MPLHDLLADTQQSASRPALRSAAERTHQLARLRLRIADGNATVLRVRRRLARSSVLLNEAEARLGVTRAGGMDAARDDEGEAPRAPAARTRETTR